MKKSNRLNSTLAVLVGVYFLAALFYHQQAYPQLAAAAPEDIAKLSSLSAEVILSDKFTRSCYTISGLLVSWLFLYATHPTRYNSPFLLFTALIVWIVRLVVFQTAYLFLSDLQPHDFGMLIASILVLVPLVLLILGPEHMLYDEADEERIQAQMRAKWEELVDTQYDGNVDAAIQGATGDEDNYMMYQMDALLATIDQEIEEEQQKKKKKESKKKK
jgi:hypothetical protein